MNSVTGAEGQTTYQIKVKGRLDERWSDWFNEMTIEIESDDPSVTRLTGLVIDQARLRGIVSKLWDLNLTVVAVTALAETAQTASTSDKNGG
jgi:hypothetical protein